MKQLSCVFLFFACATLAQAKDVKLSLEEKGIAIDAGSAGKFVLQVPQLLLKGGEGKEAGILQVSSPKKGKATYPSGATMEIEISGKNEVTYTYAEVPESGHGWQFAMEIPGNFINGGKFAFGSKPPVEFPKEKSETQHIDKGDTAGKLTLTAPGGGGLIIDPPTNWYGMQDNRTHGWGDQFVYSFLYDLKAYPGKKITIKISGL